MRNRKLPLIASLLAGLFGASVVLACGFDFPWDLLTNRTATLDTMPINNTFAYAAARLAPSPKDDLHAIEPEFTEGDTGPGTLADALTQAETAGLSSTEAATLQQMRAETSGDLAYDEGKLLPASVRLYTAGAVDFHKGDTSKAISRFEEILDLPANERRDREVWAAYMLGRLYGSKGESVKASKSFALTRDFVTEGAPDPLGLAVASYGEEARLHLDRARELQKSKKKSAKQRQKYGQEIASAMALYAEQAAHGSKIAIDSLRSVADEVLGDDATVEASICDPMVQSILVDRLLADQAGPP
jgi:cellulose synthase operon protein C